MITPQEKAEQIYNDFECIIYTDQDHYAQVKKCSIMLVDEVMKAIRNDQSDTPEFDEMYNNYWLEVKNEILKMKPVKL